MSCMAQTQILKQCRTIFEVYFESLVIFNAQVQALINRNNSRIQEINVKFLRTIDKKKQEGLELDMKSVEMKLEFKIC